MERFQYSHKEKLVQSPLQLGFLASHNGTDMQGIVGALNSGELKGDTRIVISNNSKSKALLFAQKEKIPTLCINDFQYVSFENVDKVIRDTLILNGVNLVILSGYMKKIGPLTREAFPHRILNVHPSLLPRYEGLWGDAVHQAVLESGEQQTGVTIHTIDEEYDKGTILLQSAVPVEPYDTVETLRARVQAEELTCFIQVLKDFQTGGLNL